jgi:peptidoglycan/LPS O-acetylase OafA/YrhL
MTKKLYLESLRGVAAIAVALFHFRVGSIFEGSLSQNSWLMVDFFFVLSGYVICLSYKDRLNSAADVLAFQKRRFWRLYPLHLVMLIVAVAIETAKLLFEARTGIAANTAPFSVNDATAFTLHLFLLHNIVSHELTWNIPSWSISAEFYTYILFALLVWLLRGKETLRHILTFLIMAIAAAGILKHGMDSAEYGIYRCLFAFFLGSLCCELETRWRGLSSPWPPGSWLAGASLLMLFGFVTLAGTIPPTFHLVFPLICCVAILMLGTCTPSNIIIRLLELRGLVFLGTISYGIYMIHTTVWWFIKQVLRFFGHIPTVTMADGSSSMPIDNLALATGVHLAGLGLIILAAYLSYRWLEQPLIRRFK